ncbi:hypothetical protein LYNGBM3L_17160 [Moorena producens 3L]|uniref:Uncharacterized protein n=1 Tax=Moorena producens 3L TaxID=489825 RepID=F4XSB4_9CYAN|nr:hypothetical protein LYNGBM3L_17160 [Moorena producens 3L]
MRPKGDLLALGGAHRGGLWEFCSPQASNPSLGGLGGQNHTQNQQRQGDQPNINKLTQDD